MSQPDTADFRSPAGSNSSPISEHASHAVEVRHWNDVDSRGKAGERQFWVNHPRVAFHYNRKGTIDGREWPQWVVSALGQPAAVALELGCGSGDLLARMVRDGVANQGVGLDLDRSRFLHAHDPNLSFIEADVNVADLGREQ
jgi:hypothetical protein